MYTQYSQDCDWSGENPGEGRGPFLESPGNLPGPISVFGDRCFLTEVNFCQLWILNLKIL